MNRNVAKTRDAPSAFAEHRPACAHSDRAVRRTQAPTRDPSTGRGTHPPTAPAAASVSEHLSRPLIVHCHLRWDVVQQRPRQLFSRLAAQHPVLFIEDPVHEPVTQAILRMTEPQPQVVRVVPVLPESHPRDVDAQCASVVPLLRAALASDPRMASRFAGAVQWFCTPMTVPVYLGQFGTVGVVYDCMDEPANVRFAPPVIAARERILLGEAKLVFTGSLQRFEAKSCLHHNVHCFGCGVDVAHYAQARAAGTEVPPEIAGLPSPVLGYFGVIDERIDYALLERLADAFPEGSIAMVGPVANVDPESLPRRPNLHWLGQRDYDRLPALVKGFDVCLIPFALTEATRFINPTKTLEYMAAGKPIVSTAVPDVMRQFVPIIEVAHDHDGFIDATARAWRAPCVELLVKGVERAQRATWEAIVASMHGHLLEAFRPARAAALPGNFFSASARALGGE
jgi:glycosyltransferase involved in cell wall biosynthesis